MCTQHGVEVDFIIYGPQGLYAIEVKNSQMVDNKDLIGLNNFCQDYPEAVLIFLYRGKERLKIGKVLCIPVTDFLMNLKPIS